MQISGHKTEAIYRRSAIVNTRDVRDAGIKWSLGWVEGFEPSATGTTIQRSTS